MKRTFFLYLLILVICIPVGAQEFDNRAKQFTLVSQTEARVEASRTHRMLLCDYQPTGLYLRRNETISFDVTGLGEAHTLSSMIAYKPMWGNRNKSQEDVLDEGSNSVTATQDGILSFIFVKNEGYDTKPATVKVRVIGGKAFPLFVLNRTNQLNWQGDLQTMKDAPFVQLVSDKALITIPYKDYLRTPIKDVPASFKTIHQVIDWEDEVAGFDNSSPANMRSRNRVHYMVDLYSTKKEADDYYMYAMDYFIGMKRDNFTDLTDKLATEWGIWHETGHTHQQSSWTFDAITEISVNIFSLYVQERFGRPSRITTLQEGETQTSLEKAAAYIAQPRKNYLVENPDDYDEFFTKLVMFHQLRTAYGWDAFKKLHQYFRKQPYTEIDGETDADKANKFVYAMCFVTRNNLVPFFRKWGLNINAVTAKKITALKLPLPPTDPSTMFK